ncbi:MAG: hypothetical protein ACOCWM_03175 [Cyclobacteriaceae bacterium]
MKLKFTYLIVFTIVINFGCEKESKLSTEDKIIGTWISEDKSDTLDFVDYESFYKSSVNMRYDHYDYSLLDDSIEIGYRGRLYILVTPTIHSYNLSDDKLTIDFSNKKCYGFGLEQIDYYKK